MKQVVWQIRLVFDVRRHDALVPLREHLGQPRPENGVLRAREGEVGGARADLVRASHRYDRRRQALREGLQYTLVAGPGPVDLVHEHQRRNVQPLQRAHQDSCLRLNGLDR